MSKLTESSTRDDVLEAIYDGGVICFADIPVSYKTLEMAVFWIENAPAETPLDRDFLYSTVPQSFRSDEFLLAAVKQGCFVLKDTKPEQTGIYREIACIAIQNSRYALNSLDPTFHDEEMLEFVFSLYPNRMHEWSRRVDGLVDIMSDDLIHRCCQAHFLFALDAPAHRMKWDIGRYLEMKLITAFEINRMRCKRLTNLISVKLRDEPWPFSESDMATDPGSLMETQMCLEMCNPGCARETIYMACMMREPIEKVVPAMNSNRLKKLLFEMYSQGELAPYLQDDNLLRGAYLEDAFGL